MFVRHESGISESSGTDIFLDLSQSQERLQLLQCYASYVNYFYANGSYPLACDIRLPLPFPMVSVAALNVQLEDSTHILDHGVLAMGLALPATMYCNSH